jgi:hypothetical protein
MGVGDEVEKRGGDYSYEGVVRAVVVKASGAVRYVVEDARGLLSTFSEGQLALRKRAEKEKVTG